MRIVTCSGLSVRRAASYRRWPLLVVLMAALAVGAGGARAQPDLQPPNRFYGGLTVGGRPAPVGTLVTAVIGGLVCGSRATTEQGRYRVDVLSSSERPGCGLARATVSFRAGELPAAETGSWAAGQFTRLDLTTGSDGGGAAGAPVQFDTARVDLESPCVPPPGETACTEERRRLWAADQSAWTVELAARGRPEPTAEETFDEALRMRLAANDPAALGAVARVLGWPHLRITAVRFRGTPPRQEDEWIEISNLGGGPQLMDGWVLRAESTGAEFAFPDGVSLEAGASCRIYAAQPGAAACAPATFGRGDVWDDTADTAVLRYAPLDLTVDRTTYSALPDSQPPPPNLHVGR